MDDAIRLRNKVRLKMMKLREELLAVEEERMEGRNGCTLEEQDAHLENVIAWI